MLYFAYGANLNLRGMKRRCPRAVPVGLATLPGHRLEFRTFITVVAYASSDVTGALYKLTPGCWRALDDYEGDDYEKVTLRVKTDSGAEDAVVYVMQGGARKAPALAYYTDIARGYIDWKLDEADLRRARLATLHPEKAKPDKIKPGR